MSDSPFLIPGGVAVDDRGSVRFVNEFNFKDVKRFFPSLITKKYYN